MRSPFCAAVWLFPISLRPLVWRSVFGTKEFMILNKDIISSDDGRRRKTAIAPLEPVVHSEYPGDVIFLPVDDHFLKISIPHNEPSSINIGAKTKLTSSSRKTLQPRTLRTSCHRITSQQQRQACAQARQKASTFFPFLPFTIVSHTTSATSSIHKNGHGTASVFLSCVNDR